MLLLLSTMHLLLSTMLLLLSTMLLLLSTMHLLLSTMLLLISSITSLLLLLFNKLLLLLRTTIIHRPTPSRWTSTPVHTPTQHPLTQHKLGVYHSHTMLSTEVYTCAHALGGGGGIEFCSNFVL